MPDRKDSSLDSCVVPTAELALVSGGANANEWEEYSASLKRELQPLLNRPTPEVKAAVCGVVGFRGAAELQQQSGRTGERAKAGAGVALEQYCNSNKRLPANIIFK